MIFLSEVLDIWQESNASLQKKIANFSRLQIILESAMDELKNLKDEKEVWCSSTEMVLD